MTFKNVDDVVNKYGKYVVQQSKSNLTKDKKGGGDLYNSVSYKIEKSQDDFLLEFLMEDYGAFVDRGVKGKTSTYPETSAALSKFQYGSGTGPKGGLTKGIRKWLQKKRFQFRDKKGKFMSYESMTYLISRSIYNKGLKANLFFTKPFEAGLKRLPNDLIKGFELDIENAIILGTKK
jgi:curved DNA-binding protein CbpA